MPPKIKRSDLINSYRTVDLYRAKYRHPDLTPYGWCFHGNQRQIWSGEAKNHTLYVSDGKTSAEIDVDASIYRYFSIGVGIVETEVSIMDIEHQPVNRHTTDVKFVLETTNSLSEKRTYEKLTGFGFHTICFDVIDNGSIIDSEVRFLSKKKEDTEWTPHISTPAVIEYIKFDQKNIFREVDHNEKTITEKDINYLRELIDEVNKAQVDWGRKGSLDDRVNKFISVIKKADFKSVKDVVTAIAPYNNCNQCDAFTCDCYSQAYGFVGCQVCDGCDSYQVCSLGCDQGCYSEAIGCTCNGTCYGQGSTCRCNQRSYGFSCTCNATKYV